MNRSTATLPGTDRFVSTNGIELHVVDHQGAGAPILLLPGLSANARSFDGLVAAGLAPRHRVVAVDLRGRGRSDKPPTGYRMADHAADVIGLLDALGIDRVALGGHSFGGVLGLYLAATSPDRIERIVMLDAGTDFHPDVGKLIAPSLARLKVVLPSESAYLEAVRAQPTLEGYWDPAVESFYRAEIEHLADGTVRALTSADAIAQAMEGLLAEPWHEIAARVRQPVLLINAPGGYGPPGTPPVLPRELARKTVGRLANGHYVEVSGNHMTMLFGSHADAIVAAMEGFLG